MCHPAGWPVRSRRSKQRKRRRTRSATTASCGTCSTRRTHTCPRCAPSGPSASCGGSINTSVAATTCGRRCERAAPGFSTPTRRALTQAIKPSTFSSNPSSFSDRRCGRAAPGSCTHMRHAQTGPYQPLRTQALGPTPLVASAAGVLILSLPTHTRIPRNLAPNPRVLRTELGASCHTSRTLKYFWSRGRVRAYFANIPNM